MLFGSSGIRGIINKEITNNLAILIGKSIGSLYKKVIIGVDTRTSNQMIYNAVKSGLLSVGADVYFAMITTTPTLAYATRNFKCGVMITASHNTAEYNGIKLFNKDGSGFSEEQNYEIEKLILTKNFKLAEWKSIGKFFNYHNAVEEHKNAILKFYRGSEKKLNVVVDCGNGASCNITPYLLKELNCKVISLNCNEDGNFPARDPEPIKENLKLLCKAVKTFNADLGIAHDGDADRIAIVDDEGEFVSNDKLLALLCKFYGKGKVVVPIDTSMIIDCFVKKVIRTKVGDIFISQELKNSNAEFGGEPSGTFIFPYFNYCPDGVFSAMKVIEIAKENKISELIKGIPEYPIFRGKLNCADKKKKETIEKLKRKLSKLNYKNISDIDGIRVEFKDAWILVRASGTEPKLRYTAEAKDEKTAKELFEFIEKEIKKTLK